MEDTNLKEYQEILERADQSVKNAKTNVDTLKKILSDIRDGNVIVKQAFLNVVSTAIPKLKEYFVEQVIAGAMKSIEYAYEPYLKQLLIAAREVQIIPSLDRMNRFVVKVDTSAFGKIDEWASAVQRARDIIESRSEAKYKNKKARDFNIELASHFWKEKIYKPGREGTTYKKRIFIRRKKTNMYVSVQKGDQNKYKDTVNLRLDNLPNQQHAPFWYLIEHGNANVKTLSAGGIEYPSVQPQKIVHNFTIVAKDHLDRLLQEQMNLVEKEFFDTIEKSTGLNFTATLQNLLADYTNKITLVIDNLDTVNKMNVNEVVAKIVTTTKTYDIVRTSKGFGARFLFGSKR